MVFFTAFTNQSADSIVAACHRFVGLAILLMAAVKEYPARTAELRFSNAPKALRIVFGVTLIAAAVICVLTLGFTLDSLLITFCAGVPFLAVFGVGEIVHRMTASSSSSDQYDT